jgi:hypothetical protein
LSKKSIEQLLFCRIENCAPQQVDNIPRFWFVRLDGNGFEGLGCKPDGYYLSGDDAWKSA